MTMRGHVEETLSTRHGETPRQGPACPHPALRPPGPRTVRNKASAAAAVSACRALWTAPAGDRSVTASRPRKDVHHQEMPTETTVRSHLTPVRTAKINNAGTHRRWRDAGRAERSCTADGNADGHRRSGKQAEVLQDIKTELPYDPEIALLGADT